MLKTYSLILSVILGLNWAQAQGLKSRVTNAEKIYIEALKYTRYIAVKVGSYYPSGEGNMYNSQVTYAIGDRIVQLLDELMIVGELSDERLEEINNFIFKQCQDYFGADKIQWWPEDKFRTKYMGKENVSDQKSVDSDYYIIIDGGEAPGGNLLIINRHLTSDNGYYLSLYPEEGTFRVRLFERTKAGKKGKRVAKGNVKLFSNVGKKNKDRSVTVDEITIESTAPLVEKILAAVDDSFSQMMKELFSDVEKAK